MGLSANLRSMLVLIIASMTRLIVQVTHAALMGRKSLRSVTVIGRQNDGTAAGYIRRTHSLNHFYRKPIRSIYSPKTPCCP